MEFFGMIAFIFVMFNMGLGDKVKKLEKDVKRIKKLIISSPKGELKMSEILKELEGKSCKITASTNFIGPIECDVVSVDDEWMKICQTGKKTKGKIKIIRISDITGIDDITE